MNTRICTYPQFIATLGNHERHVANHEFRQPTWPESQLPVSTLAQRLRRQARDGAYSESESFGLNALATRATVLTQDGFTHVELLRRRDTLMGLRLEVIPPVPEQVAPEGPWLAAWDATVGSAGGWTLYWTPHPGTAWPTLLHESLGDVLRALIDGGYTTDRSCLARWCAEQQYLTFDYATLDPAKLITTLPPEVGS